MRLTGLKGSWFDCKDPDLGRSQLLSRLLLVFSHTIRTFSMFSLHFSVVFWSTTFFFLDCFNHLLGSGEAVQGLLIYSTSSASTHSTAWVNKALIWFQRSFPRCWTLSQMKSTMPFPRWTRRLPFRQCQHFEGGSRCSEVSSSFVVPIQRGGPHWGLRREACRGFHRLLHHMVEFATFCRKKINCGNSIM